MLHKKFLVAIVSLALLLVSCQHHDYTSLAPVGDDHFLRMVVETPAGDSVLFQCDGSLKKILPVRPLKPALPDSWNLGFIPSGLGRAEKCRLAEALLIGPRKTRGTLLKVVPVALLFLQNSTEKALVVAIPADPADRLDGTESTEALSLENPDIFRNIEEKIALQVFHANPDNLSWTDESGCWRFITSKMNNQSN